MNDFVGGHYLKCDAHACDHFEEIPITIDVVGKPCPKCGANLCTEQDFIDFSIVAAASRAAAEVALKNNPDTKFRLVAHNIHDGKVLRATVVVQGINPFPNEVPS